MGGNEMSLLPPQGPQSDAAFWAMVGLIAACFIAGIALHLLMTG